MQKYAVVCFLLQAVLVSCTATPNKTDGTQSSKDSVVNGRDGKSRIAEILKCFSSKDYNCVLDEAQELLAERHQRFLAEADETALVTTGRKQDENSTPSILMDTISSLVSEISDILFQGGLGGFFRDAKEEKSEKDDGTETDVEEEDEYEDDDDDEEEEEDAATEVATSSRGIRNKSFDNLESRGKKKKKKRKTVIKLLLLGAVLYFKITLLLKILAAHLQIKFLLIAAAGLLINAARFWIELKKGHNPQKVIYYEHAQHQHHYENEEEGWGGGGTGGGGGYWARNYDKDDKGEDSAQSMAYKSQRPSIQADSGYSRGEETPGSSWFF